MSLATLMNHHRWSTGQDASAQQRIKRIFAFDDDLVSSPPVIGSTLVRILLDDLMDTARQPMHVFQEKQPPPGGFCVGTLSTQQLVQELMKVQNFKFPMTFPRAITLLRSRGMDPETVLAAGLHSWKLAIFPAFKFSVLRTGTDKKVIRRKNEFWRIAALDKTRPSVDRVNVVTGDVLLKIQSYDLTYECHLKPFKTSGLPWMEEVLARLAGEKLSHDDTTNICTFVSGIALLEHGVYVKFRAMGDLEKKLKIDQQCLQELGILGPMVWPHCHSPQLYRLHLDIPNTVKLPATTQKSMEWTDSDEVQPEEPLEEHQDYQDDQQNIQATPPAQLPPKWNRPWSKKEIELMEQSVAEKKTIAKSYEIFSKLCKDNGLAVRTLPSYKRKVLRIE